MIVHRLLDVLFRGLDAVDAARDRVDSVLGREPRPDPWAVEWPPEASPTRDLDVEAPAGTEAALAANDDEDEVAPAPKAKKAEPTKPAATKPDATKSAATTSRPKKGSATNKSTAKASAKGDDGKAGRTGRKKSKASNRKGSVDRKGKDLSTARAEKLVSYAAGANVTALSEEADIDGKKVLGRVVWALAIAEQAGFAEGLTTKDMSAFLSAHADIEVFTTNIGRACRDYDELIAPSVPDGRSKRYVLTAAGQKRAQALLGN